MLCIATASAVTAIAASSFTLSWTHSVEHTRWQERWAVEAQALRVVSATVQGSGAGIDLPPDARWTAEGWTYTPGVKPLATLKLAASGQTGGGWHLCAGGQCLDLGIAPGDEATLSAAPTCNKGAGAKP